MSDRQLNVVFATAVSSVNKAAAQAHVRPGPLRRRRRLCVDPQHARVVLDGILDVDSNAATEARPHGVAQADMQARPLHGKGAGCCR